MTGNNFKGWATVGRTINLGRFNSIRIELSEEFDVGTKTHQEITLALDKRIEQLVKTLGIVQRFD